jgi:hypothetical protein
VVIYNRNVPWFMRYQLRDAGLEPTTFSSGGICPAFPYFLVW